MSNTSFFADIDPTVDPATGQPWPTQSAPASAPSGKTAKQTEAPAKPEKPSRVDVERGRILIEFPYNPDLVVLVKTMARKFHAAGKAYDPEKKLWRLPLAAASEVRNFLFEHGFDFSDAFNAEADECDKTQSLDNAFVAAAQEAAQSPAIDGKLPNGWTLFDHQRHGVKELLGLQRMILADDMGLGKTIEALVAAQLFREKVPVQTVVIAPASLQTNWRREADAIGLPISVYSWAKIPEPSYFETDFVLIADEAHYAQNPKSKRTKAFLALAEAENCRACWPLTGTPMKNAQPANLYPLLKAIRHPIASKRNEYEATYCNAQTRIIRRKTGGVVRFWDNSGASNLSQLREKVGRSLLRRRKEECLDLPEKTRILKSAEISEEAEQTFNETFRKAERAYHQRVAIGATIKSEARRQNWSAEKVKAEMKERGGVDEEGEALATLALIRAAASKAKVEWTVETTQEIVDQGHQVIVFTEFLEAARAIAKEFKVPVLSGETTREARQQIVDDFQAGRQKVFVGTIRAGGVGLTLTAANYVILHDRPLTPGDAEQAEDRAHRIGQNWPVTVFWPQAFDVDIEIDDLLVSKIKIIGEAIDGIDPEAAEATNINPRRILGKLFGDDDEEGGEA